MRAPTLHPGPCLVFLDPIKKGLRYPNLRSKTSLLLQYSILVLPYSCHPTQAISVTSSTLHIISTHHINSAVTLLISHLVHLLTAAQQPLYSSHCQIIKVCSTISALLINHVNTTHQYCCPISVNQLIILCC